MVKEVALNIVAQIMFFVVSIFGIPELSRIFIDKHAYYNKYEKMIEQCEIEEKKDAIVEEQRKYYYIHRLSGIIRSWTIGVITSICQLFVVSILNIKFANLRKSKFIIGKKEDVGKTRYSEGHLYLVIPYLPGWLWYKFRYAIGGYLYALIDILCGLAFSVGIFYLLLPSTFSSVIVGFAKLVALQTEVWSVTGVVNICMAIVDIIWNRFILGSMNENVVLFVLFLIIFSVFSTPEYTLPLFLKDSNVTTPKACSHMVVKTKDNITTSVHFFGSALYVSILIILINILLAIFIPSNYVSIVYWINSVGIVGSFAILASYAFSILKNSILTILSKINKE